MSGAYAGFITGAYGATGLVLALLVGRAILAHRALTRALARLERPEPVSPPGEPHAAAPRPAATPAFGGRP